MKEQVGLASIEARIYMYSHKEEARNNEWDSSKGEKVIQTN